MKAVHLTSVHSPWDPRIYEKQCRALAAAGIDVVLVAPADGERTGNGVSIRTVPRPTSRLVRWLVTVPAVVRAGRKERGDVYHIHDPELLPAGILIRMTGRRVIYDVHEDYETSIRQKNWIPGLLRGAVARIVGGAERVCASMLEVVIAERYYAERFPSATRVLNYPDLGEWTGSPSLFGPVKALLYTGSITTDRGALNHTRLLPLLQGFELHLVGRISPDLLRRLRAAAGPAADRLVVPFVDRFVPPAEIRRYCFDRHWLAGLALFPRTPHYARKELTKFFEYMAMGLPVVATDFPAWQDLLTESGAGVVVPPEDVAGCAASISALHEWPSEAQAMGLAGQRAVAHGYRWSTQAERLVELYLRPGAHPAGWAAG
jgi:glycosyltransferase involved in cell wall biosynthesis